MLLSSHKFARSLWRRLLQLDKPVQQQSQLEFEAEVERNYRWNFTVNFLDGIAFWFGLNFVSSSAIMPLFVSKLTDNTLLIGLVAVIAQAGMYLPQIITAGPIEKLARKKPITVNVGFFTERLPVWLWPLAALVAPVSSTWALILFLLGYAGFGLGAGVVGPAWQDLIASCFPVRRRGRFFGVTTFAGTGIGAVAAIFSGWLLAVYSFPNNFALVFLIGAIGINISWAFQTLVREPDPVAPPPVKEVEQFWPKLARIIRHDHNFRNFLQARVWLALGAMGLGFVTVAAVQRLQVPDSTVGYYTAALLSGQTSGNLLSGWLADKFGHKLSLELGGIFAATGFGLAWVSPPAGWYFVIFVCLGVAIGSTIVSGMLIAMEFSAPGQRPTYMGISSTIFGIGNGIAPLLGGLIAAYSYTWLFAASTLFSVAGVFFLHWKVREPRWQAEAQKIAG